ncbi:SitI3 family protein [Kitasatospora sp. NPDC056076]|uniref:SitI3 family protein n=1 Tax=Kitasatospora sp. NPDC056076 TaxID=3345703 RepID=UPI0035DAD232
MAISYSFELATPLSAGEVATNLAAVVQGLRLSDASADADTLLGDGARTLNGTRIQVIPKSPAPWGDPLIGGRVFSPTVAVIFRLDKMANIAGQQDVVVRLAVELLLRIPDDAVLHYDFEEIWLTRRDGGLSINERSDLWPQHRLAIISLPYRRQTQEFDFSEEG